MDKAVIIVDTDEKEYYNHHVFETVPEAYAFAEGMKAAWKISHGYSNCWHPYVLNDPFDFQEWEWMGSPGKEKVQPYLPKHHEHKRRKR
mgnify:CR=1 FL=1